jgi:hypothetical protein
MKKSLLVLLTVSVASLIFLSGLVDSIPPAMAQGCTIIDTIVIDTHNTLFTGTVNTKGGRLYEYRISGTADNGALTVRDAFWATTDPTPWSTQFQSYNFYILHPFHQGFDGVWPAYNPTHEYTVLTWGTGDPVTAQVNNDTSPTTNFTIEVCEYPSTAADPSCVIIDTLDIDSADSSYVYTPTLANGDTYNLFIVGQTEYSGAWPSGSPPSYTLDPYFSTLDDWATQSPFTFVSVQGGTFTSTTLIDTTYQADHMYQLDVVGNGSAVGIQIWAGGRGGFTVFVCDPLASTPTPTPTATPPATAVPGGWSFPIKSSERDIYPQPALADSPFSYLDYGANSTLFMYSLTVNTPVHAMVGGTVTAVERLQAYPGDSMCANGAPYFDTANGLNYCNGGDENTGLAGTPRRFFEHVSAWLITVSNIDGFSDGSSIRYVVKNPLVTVGTEITEGCILGYTLNMKIATDLIAPSETASGWVMVQWLDFFNNPRNIKPYLTDQPTDISCVETASADGCTLVANPTFNNYAAGWINEVSVETGSQAIPDATGGIVPVGNLTQRLALSPGSQYSITVLYRSDLGSSAPSFNVQLGTETATTITADQIGGSYSFTVVAQIYTPNRVIADPMSGVEFSQYDLTISPGNNSGLITVDYVCVSDDTIPAPVCLLVNNEFDRSDGWTLDGGAEFVPANGLARLPDGATLTQSLKLYPNGLDPQTYKIEVIASRPGGLSPGDTVSVNWEWDTESGTFGPYDRPSNTPQSASFVVSAETTDNLVLAAVGSDSLQIADIYAVCITTEDGTPPPGYQPPPPFSPYCKVCTYVATGDLGTDIQNLVYWLACFINQLWHCQVKTILYGIWQASVNLLSAFAFFRLWLSLTIQGSTTWTNGNLLVFARYLNGQFLNLISALNLVGFSGGESSTNIWDALVALFNTLITLIYALRDLIALAFELVGLFVTVILTLLLSILTSLIQFIPNLIFAIFTAINSPAAALPPGALQCSDPGHPLFYPCLGLWVLDHTVFTGPFQYLVPIALALLGFEILLWSINRIRSAFV